MCARICSGDISIRDLHELNSKKSEMMKLCSAAAVDEKQHSEMLSADNVISNLEQRLREYGYFQVYLQQLKQQLSFLNSVRLQGKLCACTCALAYMCVYYVHSFGSNCCTTYILYTVVLYCFRSR